MSVLDQNSEAFPFGAGYSYDFGIKVHFSAPTPSGGNGRNYCTATVLIFSR